MFTHFWPLVCVCVWGCFGSVLPTPYSAAARLKGPMHKSNRTSNRSTSFRRTADIRSKSRSYCVTRDSHCRHRSRYVVSTASISHEQGVRGGAGGTHVGRLQCTRHSRLIRTLRWSNWPNQEGAKKSGRGLFNQAGGPLT